MKRSVIVSVINFPRTTKGAPPVGPTITRRLATITQMDGYKWIQNPALEGEVVIGYELELSDDGTWIYIENNGGWPGPYYFYSSYYIAVVVNSAIYTWDYTSGYAVTNLGLSPVAAGSLQTDNSVVTAHAICRKE